jgi:hypothetical protein
LIEQDFVDIEICRRSNHWRPEHYYLGDEVHFTAIDLTLPVEEIYARVMKMICGHRGRGKEGNPLWSFLEFSQPHRYTQSIRKSTTR